MIHTNAESGFSAYGSSAPDISLLPVQDAFLDVVEHMAFYGEMLVAVTGPLGSGKTTLANSLIARREEPEEGILITADMMLGMPVLIKRLAAQLNIEVPDGIVGGREALREEIQRRVIQGKSFLVVIDQAELIDANTLNDIAHFSLVFPHGLSVVLIGLTGFEEHLRECPVQAPVHVQTLKPLSEEDAQQLLQQVYSPRNSLPFSPKDFTALYRKSGGWPGSLLTNASSYFDLDEPVAELSPPASEYLENTLEEKIGKDYKPENRFPLPHLLALTALIMGLLLTFFYSGKTEEPQETILASEDVLRGILPAEQEADLQALLAEEDRLIQQESVDIEPDFAAEIPSAPMQPDYNYGQIEATAPIQEPIEIAASEEIIFAPAAALISQVTAPEKPAVPVAIEEPAIEPKPVAAKPIATTDKDRLLDVKKGYVIQLFAGHEKNNAESFKKEWRSEIKGTLYQYETRHNNKSWFVVVAGTYKNRAEANAALNSMPAKLRSESPWIRDIASIHASLR